jgi:hypothetical protein
MRRLSEKRQEGLHEVLKNPKEAVAAWNRLANRLGVLQNNCTVVGKMNNEYSTETPMKAFLLDNSTKENGYGLILSSLFHNFAKAHNELVSVLNTRKNQIAEYRCLNLYNESAKLHPQRIREEEVFIITEDTLQKRLYQTSISSVNYGRNFVFNNFDTYQEHFLLLLQGKAEIIDDINKFKSICFNGEAFAETSEASNTLAEVRGYFYEQLTAEEEEAVRECMRAERSPREVYEYVVKNRGDLERIMLAIRSLNGVIEAKDMREFVENNIYGEDQISPDFKLEYGDLGVAKILPLYEMFEEEIKPTVLDKLPERYQAKMPAEMEEGVRAVLQGLPLEADGANVRLQDLGTALYRYIYRNLQGGILQADKGFMQFLPYREDFWPPDFEDYMCMGLMGDPTTSTLTLAHVGHFYHLTQEVLRERQQ